MHTHAEDVSEAARALALRRWSPEARLADAVTTVVRRSSDLDEDQRAALAAAVNNTEGGR